MTLPVGWIETRLGDVCELLNGRAYKRDELLQKGKYLVLRVGNFFTSDKWYYSDLELDSDKYCDDGDLLYAWSASFGPKMWYGGKVIFHYHIWRTRIQEEVLDKQYLFRWFEWDKENIKSDHGTGSTMIHVTKGDMENRCIALPPLAEQRRIVAKLDALTALLARARAELDRVPVLAAHFRQKTLHDAFSGKSRSSSVSFENWRHLPASEACTKVQSGGTPKAGFDEDGIPFLKVYNLVNQSINFDYKPQYVKATVHQTELKKSMAYPGDVLMNIVGPPLGKVAIVPESLPSCNFNQALTLFRPSDIVCSKWLYHFLCSGRSVATVVGETRGIAGQVNISLSQCRAFVIPVPPIGEQVKIVAEIDAAFARADRLEAEAARARALLDRLEAAILARAFRGELVPQDPNDEPASVLLARIRQLREAAPKSTRGRKPKAA